MNRKKSSTKKGMNFIINHLWVFLFVSQSPWNKWSDHCFQFWNSILELNWIQNSDSLWDTCSSQPSYFTLCKLFFYLLKMGKIILFIASSWSFASSEWSEVFQGSVYHEHDMLPNMYWWESPVHLHLAASTFILAYILPFLSLKSICPQHALWPLWFWSLLLHNGITASDFKAVSISAFSLYSSWNTTLMAFISLKNLSVQYTFVK